MGQVSEPDDLESEEDGKSGFGWKKLITYPEYVPLLGSVIVVVGLAVAVDTGEAGMLLLVGSVLTVLPLILDRVSQLRATYKGIELTALLAQESASEAVEQAENLQRLAASPDVGLATRKELAKISDSLNDVGGLLNQVAAEQTQPREVGSSNVAKSRRRRINRRVVTARHEFQDGSVKLAIVPGTPGTLPPVTCKVIAPDGSEAIVIPGALPSASQDRPGFEASALYPDDFQAGPLVSPLTN